jgi:hypothetical protein
MLAMFPEETFYKYAGMVIFAICPLFAIIKTLKQMPPIKKTTKL